MVQAAARATEVVMMVAERRAAAMEVAVTATVEEVRVAVAGAMVKAVALWAMAVEATVMAVEAMEMVAVVMGGALSVTVEGGTASVALRVAGKQARAATVVVTWVVALMVARVVRAMVAVGTVAEAKVVAHWAVVATAAAASVVAHAVGALLGVA